MDQLRLRGQRSDVALPKSMLLLAAAGLVLIVGAVFIQRKLGPGCACELDESDYAKAELAFAVHIAGRSRAVPAGFAVQAVGKPFRGIAIEEPVGVCRGGGTYVLRSGTANVPLLLSAPHRGSDRFTGPITLDLMVEGRAAAAAWNTVQRRSQCGHGTSDLARLERHPFTAFSAGFARALPNGRVVQVHGFDPARRTTPEGRAASIILSSGSKQGSATVDSIAECLRSQLPEERVSVFPSDVRELGALQNAQGRRLREIGFNSFVHAELSLDLRQKLISERELRRRFSACLEIGL